ncbi:MAG: redoxin domain-containing protein [Brevefilum sp.]|nr:redoxin domain-containing protein [Brevefilum sp.]
MCARQDEFNQANTQVIIVTFGSLPAIQQWMKETCVTFEVLFDPERAVYKAYGLERSWLRAWHPRVLWVYIKRWFKGGTFYDSRGDDTSQLGGDFIIDNQGLLKFVYPSHDPTDRPAVDELLAVVNGLG